MFVLIAANQINKLGVGVCVANPRSATLGFLVLFGIEILYDDDTDSSHDNDIFGFGIRNFSI